MSAVLYYLATEILPTFAGGVLGGLFVTRLILHRNR